MASKGGVAELETSYGEGDLMENRAMTGCTSLGEQRNVRGRKDDANAAERRGGSGMMKGRIEKGGDR